MVECLSRTSARNYKQRENAQKRKEKRHYIKIVITQCGEFQSSVYFFLT